LASAKLWVARTTAIPADASFLTSSHSCVAAAGSRLREGSSSFGRWAGAEITAENRRLMYAPKGCAHGFLTLVDDTELVYFASTPYAGPDERIIRWDDPRFGVHWPRAPAILSDKDRDARDYDPTLHASGY